MVAVSFVKFQPGSGSGADNQRLVFASAMLGVRLGAARNRNGAGRAVDRLRTARSVRRRKTVCEQNLLPR